MFDKDNNPFANHLQKFAGEKGKVVINVDNRVNNNFNFGGNGMFSPGMMRMLMAGKMDPSIMALMRNGGSVMENMMLIQAMQTQKQELLPPNTPDREMENVTTSREREIKMLDRGDIIGHYEDMGDDGHFQEIMENDMSPINDLYYITESVNKAYRKPNEKTGHEVYGKLVIPKDIETTPLSLFTLNHNIMDDVKNARPRDTTVTMSLDEDWVNPWLKDMMFHAFSITQRTQRNYIYYIEEVGIIKDVPYPLSSRVYMDYSLIKSETYIVEYLPVSRKIIFHLK